jgi:hypothetical protein
MAVSPLPAVDAFVDGLVDYAGLFPPAALDMATAVNNYGAYRSDPHARVLGRFIVPTARLQEFCTAAAAVLPRRRDDPPWRLAALGGADAAKDVAAMAAIGVLPTQTADNAEDDKRTNPTPATVDALEVKAASVDEIAAIRGAVPSDLELFVEVPLDPDPEPLLEALSRARAGGKMRTGGVTAGAIPAVGQVARFLVSAARVRLPFKATAGLHHAIRGRYRLTYAPDSPEAVMHGFVNVFAGAALARAGGSVDEVTALLEETDASAFRFGPTGLRWRDRPLSLAQLRDTREHFARSFGSCSFREPIEDLQAWHLL